VLSPRCTAGGILSCGCQLKPVVERRYSCAVCTDTRVLASKARFLPFIGTRGGIQLFPVCVRHELFFVNEAPKLFTIREVRRILCSREDFRARRTPIIRRTRRK
jgi:hypothetical protein